MRWECRERFARHRLQRKPLVSDPGMHHDTCVTHMPWCMSGSLTRGDGENVLGIPSACATRNFTNLVRGPWAKIQMLWRIYELADQTPRAGNYSLPVPAGLLAQIPGPAWRVIAVRRRTRKMTKKPTECRPPVLWNVGCLIFLIWYLCHPIWLMWPYTHSPVSKIIADGLVPIWHQDIYNHLDSVARATYGRNMQCNGGVFQQGLSLVYYVC